MEESILITIKKMLGLAADYTAFDTDIIVFVNSAMMTLQQMAVGDKAGFRITGYDETWSDFIPSDIFLESVKEYIYLCTKMGFDPPANSFVMEAMKQQKAEYEWRLREQCEFYPGDGTRKGYWQKVAEEDAEKKKSIDDGIDPFNGLRTGDTESEGG